MSSTLTNGETVEFGGKYLCNDYMENGEARFSANVIYYVVAKDGTKGQRIAHVICNEVMLKKNTGYMVSEQFRRLQEDIRRYLSPLE